MSNEHDRDRLTDRLLRESFTRRASQASSSASCVDAESLAAWVDGGLDRDSASRLEDHLSSCSNCQALLGAFTTTEPAARGTEAERSASFWQRWSMRWIVPMTAGATAVLVWSLVRVGQPGLAPVELATRSEPEALPPAPSAFPLPAPETSASAPASDRSAPGEPTAPPRGADSAGGFTAEYERSQSGAGAQATFARQPRLADQAAKAAAEPARPSVFSAPAPPPPAVAALPAPTPLQEQVTVAAEAPSVQAQSGERALQESRTEVTAALRSAPTNLEFGRSSGAQVLPAGVRLEFASPASVGAAGIGRSGRGGAAAAPAPASPQLESAISMDRIAPVAVVTRWRIFVDGTVARSSDSSGVWTPVPIDPPVSLTAGSAPSALVCWLVGRGGATLRSIDGTTFTRVTSPANVDLASVVASSAALATVTTVDGRTFTTSDGGQTWQ